MSNSMDSLLKQSLQSCKKVLYFVAIFTMAINLFALAFPLYSLQLFNRVLTSGSKETLLYLTILLTVILIIVGILEFARGELLIHMSHWLDNQLSTPTIMRSTDDLLNGDSYAKDVLSDLVTIRKFVSSTSIFAFLDSGWVPIYLLVIYLLHFSLGLLATVGTLLLLFIAFLNEQLLHDLSEDVSEQSSESSKFIGVAFRNAEVVQGMGMMSAVLKRWNKNNEPMLSLQDEIYYRAGIISSTTKFTRTMLQALTLALGAYLVLENKITPGAMIAASIILGRALSPVEQVIVSWKHFVTARQSYWRIKEYFEKSPLRHESIHLPRPKGYISVDNLSFQAPQISKLILSNLSFEIIPGDVVAVIGHSGAGKSTLVRLMSGAIKPSKGIIRLDGANVFTWNRDDFGKYVGYLPQNIELFSATIKDNIARLTDSEDQLIVEAATLAGCHEMILQFPQGYDTMIDLEGFALSGGQRQRIALARTLYKNPALLIFDEPSANLDKEGESALLKAITSMHERGSTIIFVTHQPSLVQAANKVLLLADGKIKLYGPTQEVLDSLKQMTTKTSNEGRDESH